MLELKLKCQTDLYFIYIIPKHIVDKFRSTLIKIYFFSEKIEKSHLLINWFNLVRTPYCWHSIAIRNRLIYIIKKPLREQFKIHVIINNNALNQLWLISLKYTTFWSSIDFDMFGAEVEFPYSLKLVGSVLYLFLFPTSGDLTLLYWRQYKNGGLPTVKNKFGNICLILSRWMRRGPVKLLL